MSEVFRQAAGSMHIAAGILVAPRRSAANCKNLNFNPGTLYTRLIVTAHLGQKDTISRD